MGTHPIKRTVSVRPIYSGAASRPPVRHEGRLTKADKEILAKVFGFRSLDEFEDFLARQAEK